MDSKINIVQLSSRVVLTYDLTLLPLGAGRVNQTTLDPNIYNSFPIAER